MSPGMSSLDSSMNSMSAAVVTDFYRRFRRHPSEAACLRLAKIVIGMASCVVIGYGVSLLTPHGMGTGDDRIPGTARDPSGVGAEDGEMPVRWAARV